MLKHRMVLGLTMIELVISMTILGILTLLAIPAFTSFIQNYRIATAGDALYYYLQYARSEAVKRNANVYVSFNTGDTWCYGINVNSACNCTIANNCSLATVSYSAAQQFSLSLSGLSGNAVYFEGSHGAANSSGAVTFTQYGQSSPLFTVSFGRLGNLQICTTGINGYAGC